MSLSKIWIFVLVIIIVLLKYIIALAFNIMQRQIVFKYIWFTGPSVVGINKLNFAVLINEDVK